MVVPYRYGADGSNRLPAMDQAQIDLMERTLHAHYPAQDIQLMMHAPVTYMQQVSPQNGTTWETWLDFHCSLRADENEDP